MVEIAKIKKIEGAEMDNYVEEIQQMVRTKEKDAPL